MKWPAQPTASLSKEQSDSCPFPLSAVVLPGRSGGGGCRTCWRGSIAWGWPRRRAHRTCTTRWRSAAAAAAGGAVLGVSRHPCTAAGRRLPGAGCEGWACRCRWVGLLGPRQQAALSASRLVTDARVPHLLQGVGDGMVALAAGPACLGTKPSCRRATPPRRTTTSSRAAAPICSPSSGSSSSQGRGTMAVAWQRAARSSQGPSGGCRGLRRPGAPRSGSERTVRCRRLVALASGLGTRAALVQRPL